MTKKLVFNMRLDEDDRRRLVRLAEHYAAPAATVIRMLVKHAAEETSAMRENQVNIRLNDEEMQRAELVARHHGLNLANLFRFLVAKEANARLGAVRQVETRQDSACHREATPDRARPGTARRDRPDR